MGHATLRVVGGPADGRSFDLEGTVELGRGGGGSAELSDPTISRRHARLVIDQAGGLSIEDLGSRNGTLVNGRLITGVETLSVGDVIDVGDTTIEVAAVEPGPGVAPVTTDQTTRVSPAGAQAPPAAEPPAEPDRTRTRSRSIAAGLPVVSARELVKRVRIRAAIATLAVAVVLWVALYAQLKNGNDPGIKKTAAAVQPATSTSQTSTTTSPTTATTTTKSS